MRVSETINLNIPDDGLDVDKLERYVAREIRKFGKQVFGKVLQEIEAKKLEEAKGKVGCREKVRRYLSTRLGLIRLERHKVKYKEKGEDDFETKLGIMYSGKEPESEKAKHRRYRLKEKVVYGGTSGRGFISRARRS